MPWQLAIQESIIKRQRSTFKSSNIHKHLPTKVVAGHHHLNHSCICLVSGCILHLLPEQKYSLMLFSDLQYCWGWLHAVNCLLATTILETIISMELPAHLGSTCIVREAVVEDFGTIILEFPSWVVVVDLVSTQEASVKDASLLPIQIASLNWRMRSSTVSPWSISMYTNVAIAIKDGGALDIDVPGLKLLAVLALLTYSLTIIDVLNFQNFYI